MAGFTAAFTKICDIHILYIVICMFFMLPFFLLGANDWNQIFGRLFITVSCPGLDQTNRICFLSPERDGLASKLP